MLAKDSFKLSVIVLLRPLTCQDYRHVPPLPAYMVLELKLGHQTCQASILAIELDIQILKLL